MGGELGETNAALRKQSCNECGELSQPSSILEQRRRSTLKMTDPLGVGLGGRLRELD
jgi:hypothetical protein